MKSEAQYAAKENLVDSIHAKLIRKVKLITSTLGVSQQPAKNPTSALEDFGRADAD